MQRRHVLAALLLLLCSAPSQQMYPASQPRVSRKLTSADGLHHLHYSEHGKPDGAPALFVHGGPGAGCTANHARFFDPDHYRILLLDQRGCGKSSPRGSLEENTTPKLVEDMETLRQELDVDAWEVVLGGSWGVALTLAYAQAHPQRVKAIVLRGVCLMRPQEIGHLFGAGGRARALNPNSWARFASHVADDLDEVEKALETGAQGELPADAEAHDHDGRAVLRAYHARLVGNQTINVRNSAASAFFSWEMAMMTAPGKAEDTAVVEWDGQQWWCRNTPAGPQGGAAPEREPLAPSAAEARVLAPLARVLEQTAAGAGDGKVAARVVNPVPASRRKLRNPNHKLRPPVRPPQDGLFVPAQPMITAHFSVHDAFFVHERALLDGVARLRSTPCVAVHGARDGVCPADTLLDLHHEWPEMEICVPLAAGHSMYDADIATALVKATDRFRRQESGHDATVPVPTGPSETNAPHLATATAGSEKSC